MRQMASAPHELGEAVSDAGGPLFAASFGSWLAGWLAGIHRRATRFCRHRRQHTGNMLTHKAACGSACCAGGCQGLNRSHRALTVAAEAGHKQVLRRRGT